VLGWLLLPNILGLKVSFAEGKHVADELQKQVAVRDPRTDLTRRSARMQA
jgi:hypothetical protein